MKKNRNYNRKIRWFAQGLLCKVKNNNYNLYKTVLDLGKLEDSYRWAGGSTTNPIWEFASITLSGGKEYLIDIPTISIKNYSGLSYYLSNGRTSVCDLGDGTVEKSITFTPVSDTSVNMVYGSKSGGISGGIYITTSGNFTIKENTSIPKGGNGGSPRNNLGLGKIGSITTFGRHIDNSFIPTPGYLNLEFVEKIAVTNNSSGSISLGKTYNYPVYIVAYGYNSSPGYIPTCLRGKRDSYSTTAYYPDSITKFMQNNYFPENTDIMLSTLSGYLNVENATFRVYKVNLP